MDNNLNTQAGIKNLEKEFADAIISTDTTPAKILNGVKIYTNGTKKGIEFKSIGQQSVLIFESGQQVFLTLGITHAPNAFISIKNNIIYAKGLNKAKLVGKAHDENAKKDPIEYDNKIFTENCKSCELETGPVLSGCIDTHDFLVMKNCKLMKVSSSQTSNLTGIMETTADVVILPFSAD